MIEHIITYIAPHLCIFCATEGSLLCHDCQEKVPQKGKCLRCGCQSDRSICIRCVPGPLERCAAVTSYQGQAKELVHQLKYERARAAAVPMAHLIAEVVGSRPDSTVITFIPTANRRVRQRGYDHAARIAKEVAKVCGLPYRPLLGRSGHQRQVGATRALRQTQLQDAFYLRSRKAMPEAVILIDDVITTGSSLASAANVLHQAGITHVEAAVFAAA
jgi:ComF family protein